jgi:hypothetical protein
LAAITSATTKILKQQQQQQPKLSNNKQKSKPRSPISFQRAARDGLAIMAMVFDDFVVRGSAVETTDTNGSDGDAGQATPASKEAIRKSLRDVIR